MDFLWLQETMLILFFDKTGRRVIKVCILHMNVVLLADELVWPDAATAWGPLEQTKLATVMSFVWYTITIYTPALKLRNNADDMLETKSLVLIHR